MINLKPQDLYALVPPLVLENLGEEGQNYIQSMVEQANDSQMSTQELKEITQELLLDAGIEQTKLNEIISLLSNLQVSETPKSQATEIPSNAGTLSEPVKASAAADAATKSSFKNKSIPQTTKAKNVPSSSIDPRKSKEASAIPKSQENDKIALRAPVISAFSQSSRFHTETLQTLSNEVNLKDVNLIVNDVPLLVDAHLQFKEGFHYGFIGKNGTGKTTLLVSIANKTLLGFPENIRVQYVEQLEVLDSSQTVLQAVIDADEERAKRISVIQGIESAINSKIDLKPVIEKYIKEEAEEEIVQAQKLANFRTGKRGLEARKVALDREKNALSDTKKKYYSKGQSHEEVAAKILENKYHELHQIGSENAEAKALEILDELGFKKEMQLQPTSNFSGGWRMRIALAKALFVQPDILFLDEPTNHLDMHSIVWLTKYLKSLDGVTLVVVSHDRKFLNDIADEIIRLKDQKLTYHSGNYDTYEKSTEDLKKKKERQYENIERKKKHINESIQRGLQQARSSGDDKKLGMVASRKKKLERMGAEKTEDGKRWKVSYFAGYHTSARIQVELEKEERDAVLKLPEPEELRHQGPLLRMTDVSFRYTKDTPIILQNISLSIEMGTRVAFLGPNGCGKSTLVSLMKQNLKPTSGRIEHHSRLKIGYFDQHFVDLYSQLKMSGLYRIMQYPQNDNDIGDDNGNGNGNGNGPTSNSSERFFKTEQDARAYLGSFGLSGSLATQPICTLSGGQKARFALAMLFINSPQLLLLDEITNHLDMRTITGLINALKEFKGGIVLVSHDQHFIGELSKTFYVIKNKTIVRWEKDLSAYVKSISKTIDF